MRSKPKEEGATNNAESELLAFSADALQSLKQNIENKFNQSSKPGSNVEIPKPRKEEKRTEAQSTDLPAKPSVPAQHARTSPRSQGKPKANPVAVSSQRSSKKRLRNGEIKDTTPGQKEKGDVNSTKLGGKKANESESISFDLRKGIRALGGVDGDYDFVTEVDSESEVGGQDDKVPDEQLEKELRNFVQGLGIDKVEYDHVDDPSDIQEGSEDDVTDDRAIKKNKIISNATERAKLSALGKEPASRGQVQLKMRPLSEWHAAYLPPISASPKTQIQLPQDLIDGLHEHAKALLEEENRSYKDTQRSISSSYQFYTTIISSGTLSDKIGALTLSIQESPLHNVKALESLIALARKRSRAQAVEVLGALKDLFGHGNLLPSDRKLRTFESQPALYCSFGPKELKWTFEKPLPKELTEAHLIFWAYEDWLKSAFFQVLKIIETWCNDEVVFARGKAVDYVFALIKEKPEQEANLLRMLVNKLGDSDKKVASMTSFNILQLETTHPSMKEIIISAIESDLLFRPGQSLHAQYYATITLNQTVLSSREDSVAKKLLDIYFALFLKLLEKPKSSKPEATGANTVKGTAINRKGEVQGGGGAGGKRARKRQLEMEKSTASDEELREKMLSAVLTGVNRALPFSSTNDEAFERHLDTLFLVTHSSNFNTSIQALMLIQQLQGSNQNSADRFYRTLYESLLDSRLLTSSKQILFLNLLFRSLRSDLNIKRVKAFAKRLLQVVSMHQPSFICGVIYLLRELETVFPSLSTFISQPEDDPSDEEENFHDVIDNESEPSPSQTTPSRLPMKPTSKQHHKPLYDGRKRDPLHAEASTTTLWDLYPFLLHYHPSVSLFASRLLDHEAMPPKPELSLNTLIHFLDRFVYKNPKTNGLKVSTKGASIMQPLAGSGDKSGLLVSKTSARGMQSQPTVNSEQFWKKEQGDVNADEVFFHRYFSVVGKQKEKLAEKKTKKAKLKKRGGDDDDGGSGEEDDADEEEIWKALVGSKPEIEGFGEGEEESFSDLEGLDDEGEDAGYFGVKGEDALGEEGDDGGMDDEFPDFRDEEEEALLGSDDDVPSDLDAVFEAENQGDKKNRSRGKDESAVVDADVVRSKRAKKRRRLKNLPVFAGVEEFEKLLGGDEEEGVT